jgi:hypothetical protein
MSNIHIYIKIRNNLLKIVIILYLIKLTEKKYWKVFSI